MRILHIWQSTYPWEVRVGKINRALKNAGHEITVLARNSGTEPNMGQTSEETVIRVGGNHHRVFSLPVPGNPVWSVAIQSAIEKTKAQLVIVRDIPLAPAAASAAHRARIPVVLDMAEHYPEAMRSWKKYSDSFLPRLLVHRLKLPDRIEAHSVDKMDGILVVCEEMRDRLINEFGVAPEKICLVLNTPEIQAWADFPKGCANTRPFCFGYHGILAEDRQLDTVLKGFDLAAENDPDITLLIAGGGESETKLRSLMSTLRYKSRITMTGRYKPDEQAGLYARADFGIVSLLPNIFTEHTVANKFFDYACLGKPFIYTDLAPLNRIMDKLNCGLRFRGGDPQSCAQAMLSLKSMNYDELSQNGIRAIDGGFNWQQDSVRLCDFIAKLQQ